MSHGPSKEDVMTRAKKAKKKTKAKRRIAANRTKAARRPARAKSAKRAKAPARKAKAKATPRKAKMVRSIPKRSSDFTSQSRGSEPEAEIASESPRNEAPYREPSAQEAAE
jgi:hypothetical protein